MMKRGAIDQVFIYIFVVIVIAFIMFFGFKQIANVKNLSDKSTYVAFKSDFSNAVNDIYYKNPGSVIVFSRTSKNKPLSIPKEIKKVCFEENKVVFNSEDYFDFTVDNLISGVDCINADSSLSFKLENFLDGEDIKVRVYSVGT